MEFKHGKCVGKVNCSHRPVVYGWLAAVALSLLLPAWAQAQAVLPAGESANGYSADANTFGDSATSAPAQLNPEKMGDSLAASGRYLAAAKAYAQIAHPSAVVWNKMGIAYQMMFNLKEATRCYKESLRIDPRNSMVINNIATVDDSLKQYRAAERLYRKAFKIDPSSALILKNLGTNLVAQHKNRQGWRVYQQALALDPHIFENQENPRVENPASLRERGAMNYYMALGCAREGLTECALQYLRLALNEGFVTARKVANEPEFAGLRKNPAFQQLLAEQKTQKAH